MKYAIFTDSSANLSDATIEQYDLRVVSLVFYSEGKEYVSYQKGVPSDLGKFYDMLRKRLTVTTSCINAATFEKAFKEALEQGEDILYVGFSSALSGTFASAQQALNALRPLYPERTMVAVDTLGASLGEGLLVVNAAKRKEAGQSLEEVAAWLEANKLKLCHFFTVDDLYYLFRGGRVSRTGYLVASLISIKPIMHMDNKGNLTSLSRVTGRKKSLSTLAELVAQHIEKPEEQTIFISHGDCMEDVNFLIGRINSLITVKGYEINYVDPVVGVHSGPGTVAVFCLGDKR